jgi:Holliday junction resolvase RusA-like endonuclease
MEYVFTIRGRHYKRARTFPGLNEYLHECSSHPQAGAAMKKKFQKIASDSIRLDLRGLKITKPVILHYRFFEPDKRRDKGNIFSFADKVIEDALQECGTIRNDGWKEIENFTHDFYVDQKHPRIEVVIEEVG